MVAACTFIRPSSIFNLSQHCYGIDRVTKVIPLGMFLPMLKGEWVVSLDQFWILVVVSTNIPRNVLPVVKAWSFLYFGLKMPRIICVDGDEVLGIKFLRCVLVYISPVRCTGIDACLVRIYDRFFGNLGWNRCRASREQGSRRNSCLLKSCD